MEPAAGIMVGESPISNNNNNGDDDEESYSNNNNNSSERADNDVMLLALKSVHNQATDLFVPIGEVNIYCIYNANPTELVPNSTRWFKDGKPLAVTSLQSEQQQQQSRMFESMTPTGYPVLTIRLVNRRDAGLYDCQLSNTVGTSERLPSSEACRVEVNFKPSVKLRIFKPQVSLVPQMSSIDSSIPMDELIELDINKELVLPGSTFVLVCDVIEAQPRKIQKYHWFKTATSQNAGFRQTNKFAAAGNGQQQLISVTESKQFVLNSLAANFTLSSFTCSAFNALGPSEQSNQVEVQLSYSPGKSFEEIFSNRARVSRSGSFKRRERASEKVRTFGHQTLIGTRIVYGCYRHQTSQSVRDKRLSVHSFVSLFVCLFTLPHYALQRDHRNQQGI